jgi:hypothetical protein
MLTCEKATRLISDGMEQPLGLGARVRLRMHLFICNGCTNFQRQARVLRELAGHYAAGLAPGAGDDPEAQGRNRPDTAD